ncbi:MAG TPA: hypothetical protein PKH58_13125, partial [Paludibacteraceae bacterium]|nr:hypothetical protein [Paludibacteraceae bacterium]
MGRYGLPYMAPGQPTSIDWDFVELTPDANSQLVVLPPSVDNSQKTWFPYIYNQGSSGSCVHVSEVFYMFTYELNRKFNREAGTDLTKTNLFHPLYSYNYLNNGDGSSFTGRRDGFKIVRDCGVPEWIIYDDSALLTNSTKYKYWMTGYDKYNAGMCNTISNTMFQFPFTYDNTFLNNIKHWLNDHCNASASGGLASIGVFTIPWVISQVQSGTYATQNYIKQLGVNGIGSGHQMTICGYDEDVTLDWGGGGTAGNPQPDGQFRNDIDNNHDGVIDIRDYEIGAFKVANSWGENWDNGNQGFIWMPYCLFYPGNIGFNGWEAESCDVFGETGEIPQPAINLKVNMEHDHRDHIKCSAGYAPAANNNNPLAWDDLFHLTYRGGFNPMRGCYTGPIDFGINVSQFYDPDSIGKLFFQVKENNNSGESFHGKINSLSLLDSRWGEEFELPCKHSNFTIPNNSTTTLSIEYHLLPHESPLSTDLTLNSNRVSRFTTTVPNGKTLSVGTNANIDMYNSEIHIEEGGNLVLSNYDTIIAKRGTCKLVIDGNISVGG